MMAGPPSSVRSSLSIAMCTYNGERYLKKQLDSILSQTRLPDELILCDDRSSDATTAIVEAFVQRAPFPVRFKVNEENLGSTRNFEQAILACTGDLIALCDQDDLWHPQRLERCAQELQNQPEAGLVFSNAEVIDASDQPLGYSLWENFAFDRDSLESLQAGDPMPMTKRAFVTGATVMFRSRYARICFPTGEHWIHDGWLAMLIVCMASIRPIDERLISYRLHSAQQVGLASDVLDPGHDARESLQQQAAKHATSVRHFYNGIDEVCRAAERLPLTPEQRTDGALDAFLRHRDFLAMRLSLPQSRLARLPIVLDAIEQYRISARGALSAVKDVLLPKPPG